MSEAELLQNNETLPAVDREKLLNEAQNREFNRLLWWPFLIIRFRELTCKYLKN